MSIKSGYGTKLITQKCMTIVCTCVVCVIEEKEGHNNNIPCFLNVKIWVFGLKLSIKRAMQKGLFNFHWILYSILAHYWVSCNVVATNQGIWRGLLRRRKNPRKYIDLHNEETVPQWWHPYYATFANFVWTTSQKRGMKILVFGQQSKWQKIQ
jgi:hypothetical protein